MFISIPALTHLPSGGADKDKVFASQVQFSLSLIYSSVLHCSPVKPFGVRGQPRATGVMTD